MSNYNFNKIDEIIYKLLKVQAKLDEIEIDGVYTMSFDEREFEIFVMKNAEIKLRGLGHFYFDYQCDDLGRTITKVSVLKPLNREKRGGVCKSLLKNIKTC